VNILSTLAKQCVHKGMTCHEKRKKKKINHTLSYGVVQKAPHFAFDFSFYSNEIV